MLTLTHLLLKLYTRQRVKMEKFIILSVVIIKRGFNNYKIVYHVKIILGVDVARPGGERNILMFD